MEDKSTVDKLIGSRWFIGTIAVYAAVNLIVEFPIVAAVWGTLAVGSYVVGKVRQTKGESQ